MHSDEDHADEKNKLKFLKPQQSAFLRQAVKISPQQTAGDLIKNIQSSPSKKIPADLKHSVARAIRKERSKLCTVMLGGVELDNTLGALRQVTVTY